MFWQKKKKIIVKQKVDYLNEIHRGKIWWRSKAKAGQLHAWSTPNLLQQVSLNKFHAQHDAPSEESCLEYVTVKIHIFLEPCHIGCMADMLSNQVNTNNHKPQTSKKISKVIYSFFHDRHEQI